MRKRSDSSMMGTPSCDDACVPHLVRVTGPNMRHLLRPVALGFPELGCFIIADVRIADPVPRVPPRVAADAGEAVARLPRLFRSAGCPLKKLRAACAGGALARLPAQRVTRAGQDVRQRIQCIYGSSSGRHVLGRDVRGKAATSHTLRATLCALRCALSGRRMSGMSCGCSGVSTGSGARPPAPHHTCRLLCSRRRCSVTVKLVRAQKQHTVLHGSPQKWWAST